MNEKRNKTKAKGLVKSHQPTPQEPAALEAHRALTEVTPSAPRMKLSVKSEGAIELQGSSLAYELLMEALGTSDQDFLHGLLLQLRDAGAKGGKVDESALKFMLSVVKGIEPQDQLEAMLAAQMAAVHMATMRFAHSLANVAYIAQQDSAERAFNKLARTFVAQVEALKRYRSGGEQTARVGHVTVNEGGQAIVGNVTHGRSGSRKNQEATS
jgi:hypothetical protein